MADAVLYYRPTPRVCCYSDWGGSPGSSLSFCSLLGCCYSVASVDCPPMQSTRSLRTALYAAYWRNLDTCQWERNMAGVGGGRSLEVDNLGQLHGV